MKILMTAILSSTLLASPTFAYTFTCQGKNHVATLNITAPMPEYGSYYECNGGVGDEMRDCKLREFQTKITYAVIKLNINEDTLSSKIQLRNSDTLNGFDMLRYQDQSIHLTLTGSNTMPVLNLRIMASSAIGKPVHVDSDSLSCR